MNTLVAGAFVGVGLALMGIAVGIKVIEIVLKVGA